MWRWKVTITILLNNIKMLKFEDKAFFNDFLHFYIGLYRFIDINESFAVKMPNAQNIFSASFNVVRFPEAI